MKVDRYTKVVLTVIAVALSALAFKDIVAPQPAVAAAPAIQCSFPSSLNIQHSAFPGLNLSHSGSVYTGVAPAPSPDSQ